MVNDFLTNTDIYETLCDYCQFLSDKYNETGEGKYRIKYNDLHPFLYNALTDAKKVEFFDSFATSLEIYPILNISISGIQLQMF